MDKHNPLHKLSYVLVDFSKNNEAEQEAIGKYYELRQRVHDAMHEFRMVINPATGEVVNLEDVDSSEITPELQERLDCYMAIKEFCIKVLKKIDHIIAEEKEHTLILNALAQEVDGIAPELD